ncbi:hypothetical protein [Streptomyces sp. SID12501]|uniref:Uncharacterized protein n=1 Tax=Streptomyces sp. SID12501 TaxID=2706042 RepID=A0A6B3BJA9_9ACTN|nr:hypothetical protein [Streptomyces sp. SID12501]NEC85318.1 hypothetical protein [Streptomyces sp. SID12501]
MTDHHRRLRTPQVHFTAEALVRVPVDASALAYGEWRRLVRPGRGPADVLLAGLMPSR